MQGSDRDASRRARPVVAAWWLALALAGCASSPSTSTGPSPHAPVPAAPAADASAPVDLQRHVDAEGIRTETGTLDGAPYRIELPRDWNGELVVFAHGYETVGSGRQLPWPRDETAAAMLARGYAIAASGYSRQGWAVAEAVPQTERVRERFVAEHGQPGRSWLIGHSMGGQVVLASAERYPHAYDGVLSLCGVNTPARAFFTEGVLAPLAAFDAWFPGVLPQAPGGLADPSLPGKPDGDAIASALAADEAKAALLAKGFEIPRDGLAGALWLQYVALRELAQRAGGFPVDNRDYRYRGFGDDAALDRAVRRYAADPRAAAYVDANAALTGDIEVPLVLQWNRVDPIVPPRFGARYLALARAAGAAQRVTALAPVGEGHCKFEPAQTQAAFDALRAKASATR